MSGIQFTGRPLTGEQQAFLARFQSALAAHGVTQLNVISGYRSPAYNASVGGAPNSNHTTGQAIDATAYIPGRGWIPAGALLAADAARYGLRSGDQPGFFHGQPDPNHVDDAANVGGVAGSAGPHVYTASSAPASSQQVPSQLVSSPAPAPAQPQGAGANPAAILALLASRQTPLPVPAPAALPPPPSVNVPAAVQAAIALGQQHVLDTANFRPAAPLPSALKGMA